MTRCGWGLVVEETTGPCSAFGTMSAPDQQSYLDYAADLLYEWTGRIFGVCEVELRPCLEGARATRNTFYGTSAIGTGLFAEVRCGQCAGACRCGFDGTKVIALPGPVHEVTSVSIDGIALPSEAWTVMYSRMLVRLDGGTWPRDQDLSAPPTASGTFVVSYLQGIPVPAGGLIAARALACELAKAVKGDNTCQLPRRVTSISRQGVTIAAALDTFDDLERGRTGIWLVDSWVSSMQRPRPSASVRSVDIAPDRVGGRAWRTN